MPRHCAFLTLAERGDYVIDDEHAYKPLADLGWQVEAVPWNRADVDWSAYELVVIRSTWDYQHSPEKFLETLEVIEASTARLENPRKVVEWNISKTYLRDLDQLGVEIVPTLFYQRLDNTTVAQGFDAFGSEEIVIKPQIGATAIGAFRLNRENWPGLEQEIKSFYSDKALLVQPFMPDIANEGEYSLFYFNGEFSHAILKTPKAKDFRSQEEHGARISATEIDGGLHAAGKQALEAVGQTLLYARVDFVRASRSPGYRLMELELIEPSLYLRMHPEAPARFAKAIDAWMR